MQKRSPNGAGAEFEFFSLSPFDPARFAALSKGLEVAVILRSALERTARIDAEFFRHAFLGTQAILARCSPEPITESVSVSDGNHFTISEDFVEDGVPYFRGQDISGEFFLDGQASIQISREAYERKYMRRSHLAKGDVLVSIVGTIGSLGTIDTDQPATCSCKLAILRPRGITPAYLAVFLRSKFGALRIQQLTRGAVQRGLILEDMDQIGIARFAQLEPEVVRVVQRARTARDATAIAQRGAEEALLDALGLQGWSPPEPLSYIRSAADVVQANRLDATFHSPRVQALLARLSSSGTRVGDFAKPRRELVRLDPNGGIDYIEISDLRTDGRARATPLDAVDAPSRAKWIVHSGDVITSTVRPLRRLSALITPAQEGFVASSGFLVLEPTHASARVLLSYLRLPIVCELMDMFASASMYPAIADRDILGLAMPLFSEDVTKHVDAAVARAHEQADRSALLLATATRAVEIAIEEGEAAALAYLVQAQEADNAIAA